VAGVCCDSPTLFIGEDDSVVYALPSLVDENTVRVMVIVSVVAQHLFHVFDFSLPLFLLYSN